MKVVGFLNLEISGIRWDLYFINFMVFGVISGLVF